MKTVFNLLSYISLRGILVYLYSIGTGAIYYSPSEFLIPFLKYIAILIAYTSIMVLFEIIVYKSIHKEKRIRNATDLLISIALLCMYIVYYIVPIIGMVYVFNDKINTIGAILCVINYDIVSYFIQKSRKI